MEFVNRILMILAGFFSLLLSSLIITFGVSIWWLTIPLFIKILFSCFVILAGIGFGAVMITLIRLAW